MLALFSKVIRKVATRLTETQKEALSADLPPEHSAQNLPTGARDIHVALEPVNVNIEKELAETGDEELRAMREKQREMISALDLNKCVFESIVFDLFMSSSGLRYPNDNQICYK